MQAHRTDPNCAHRWLFSWSLALAACFAVWTSTPGHAAAQVKSAGRHLHYGVELEPHLVWQWNGDEIARSDGIGMGFRASIPIMQDGPVPTINNSLAITFGFDWAHFPECYDYRGCSEDDFWVPVAVQWNFYLTPRFSLFPEFGLGFRDAVLNYDEFDDRCRGRGCRGYALEVHPVLWFGARFLLTDYIALVFRLGTPSLQLGVSFFI
jgi:hypothetical protein